MIDLEQHVVDGPEALKVQLDLFRKMHQAYREIGQRRKYQAESHAARTLLRWFGTLQERGWVPRHQQVSASVLFLGDTGACLYVPNQDTRDNIDVEPLSGEYGARIWNSSGWLRYFMRRPAFQYRCALCHATDHWTEECMSRKPLDFDRCGWCSMLGHDAVMCGWELAGLPRVVHCHGA